MSTDATIFDAAEGLIEPNPIDFPLLYEKTLVGGVESPGVAEVEPGLTRDFEWDVKASKGTKGATTTLKSRPPVEFGVKYLLWKVPGVIDEMTRWTSEYLPLLKRAMEKDPPQALDFYHPDTAELDVKSVTVKNIGAKKHEGKGLYSVTVTFLEYFPPKPKGAGTPKSAASQAAADAIVDALNGLTDYGGKIGEAIGDAINSAGSFLE